MSVRRVTRRDLALFTRSLALLLRSGLPMEEALRLAADVASGPLRGIVDDLRDEIRAGHGLGDALDRVDPQPDAVFGPVYRALVHAAEAGGSLDLALTSLAEYLERAERLAQSVRSALIYPAFLLGAALVSLIVLLVYVVPRYELLFAGMGQELPLLSRMVIGSAGFIRNYSWVIPIGLGAAWLYWRWRADDEMFRQDWDARLLRLPLAGPIIEKVALERLARTLSELTANGVEMPQALVLGSEAAGNRLLRAGLQAAASRLREGMRLSDALDETGTFPDMLVQLTSVGEESGNVAEMLAHAADIYALDVEAESRRLIALLEPILVLLIGLIMAFIIVALIGAVVSVNDLVVL